MRKNIVMILGILILASINSLAFAKENPLSSSPCENISILRTLPQNRTYVEIGEVSVVDTVMNWAHLEKMLREKVQQLGGNAVYISEVNPIQDSQQKTTCSCKSNVSLPKMRVKGLVMKLENDPGQ